MLIGWIVAIVCLFSVFWLLKLNNELSEAVQKLKIEKLSPMDSHPVDKSENDRSDQLLSVVRSKEYRSILLAGNQAVTPNAFAKVYLNKKEGIVYLDAIGLDTAPDGKVYQFWSLTMEPFTAKNIGLLNVETEVEPGVYKFNNNTDIAVFAVSLELEGGSDSPSLTQLIVLSVN